MLDDGAAGILMDLGISSHQLDTPHRGFSYSVNGPLDSRMDPEEGETATELLSRLDERELTRILREFGEDPQARRIARAIVHARQRSPIRETGELAEVISRAVPATRHKSLPRVFQALRITVNREMEELDQGLAAAWSLLRPGGRLVAISYHSLEDRRVKTFMRDKAAPPQSDLGLPINHEQTPAGRLLVKKPIVPTDEEIGRNPRARSAKLRALERIQ